jgi:hypothetical protein
MAVFFCCADIPAQPRLEPAAGNWNDGNTRLLD